METSAYEDTESKIKKKKKKKHRHKNGTQNLIRYKLVQNKGKTPENRVTTAQTTCQKQLKHIIINAMHEIE